MGFEFLDCLLGEFTTTPLVHLFLVVSKESRVDGVNNLCEGSAVFWLDFGKSNAGACLHANDLAKAGLALDNAVWDFEVAAESWHPDDEFDWVDIVSDDDELGLLGLDGGCNILDTLDESLLVARAGDLEVLLSLLSIIFVALLLLSLCFWAVLLEELEEGDSGVLAKCVVEVVDWWWDLQALHEDSLLALKLDILWKACLGCLVSNLLGCLFSEEVFLADDVLVFDDFLWG